MGDILNIRLSVTFSAVSQRQEQLREKEIEREKEASIES